MPLELQTNLVIRGMKVHDLAFAAECTAAEGWVSENRTSLEGFLLFDPKGSLIAEEAGRPVGICIATNYGKSGFVGELIVRSEERGRGVGAIFSFALQADARQISLGILETNPHACGLVRSLGFTERVDSPWRMALGNSDALDASSGCYAVGSAAKG